MLNNNDYEFSYLSLFCDLFEQTHYNLKLLRVKEGKSTKSRVHSECNKHDEENNGENISAPERGNDLRIHNIDESNAISQEEVDLDLKPISHITESGKDDHAVEQTSHAVDNAAQDGERLDVGVLLGVAGVRDEHAESGSETEERLYGGGEPHAQLEDLVEVRRQVVLKAHH